MGASPVNKTALTIAGSDPSAGAGIQQDLRVLWAHGVWGVTAVTAVTVQDASGVRDIHPVPWQVVGAQIDAACADAMPAAAKTGMLCSGAVVRAVCDALDRTAIPALVVDPVLAAGGGAPLLDPAGIDLLRDRLVPRATIITPNAPEAAALTGIDVSDEAGQHKAARMLIEMGATAALVTGGHLPGRVVDIYADRDGIQRLDGPRIEIDAGRVHGTGCVVSAAIAAGLALGYDRIEAVRRAKAFTEGAIRAARPGAGGAAVADGGHRSA